MAAVAQARTALKTIYNVFFKCIAVKTSIFCCTVRLVCFKRNEAKEQVKGSYSHLHRTVFLSNVRWFKAPTQFPFSVAGTVTAPYPVLVCFKNSLHL